MNPPGPSNVKDPPGPSNVMNPPGPTNVNDPPGPPNLTGDPVPPTVDDPPNPPSVHVNNPPGPTNVKDPPGPPNLTDDPVPPNGDDTPRPPSINTPPGPPTVNNPPGPPSVNIPPGPPSVNIPPGPPTVNNPPGPQNLKDNPIPPQDLIAAPEPEGVEKEEEEVEVDPEIKKFGVVLNGINICANVVTKSYLPHVGNCSSFIECDKGVAYPGTCYNKQTINEICDGDLTNCEIAFDYTYQTCNRWPRADETSHIRCMPECSQFNLTSFCYDRTCTKYVLCYYGIPVLRECMDGLQYNSETDRCDFPEFVDCVDNECSNEITPRDIVYIASKARCDKYYICSDGKAFSQECTKGLYYNPAKKSCDFKTSVDCKITAQKRNIKPFSRSPPRRADIICPENGIHFIAHKNRNDAYYYCVNGSGVILDCTPGLIYDPEHRECRESQYVGN